MGKLYWLKTKVGIFSDPRMIFLLNQPNGDSYLTLWTFLKDMAGQVNDSGKIYVAEKEPMTVALIAKCLHRRKPFIEKGLAILAHIGLIEQNEDGMLRVKIWDELQDFQRDEHRREQNAKRQQRYRERQRQAETKDTSVVTLTSETVGACMKCPPDGTEIAAQQKENQGEKADAEAPAEYLPESVTEEPPMVQQFSSYQSVKHYRNVFHGINSVLAEKLAELERIWGTQATCTAIDIAKTNRKSHVNYIAGILRQSNGHPVKEETHNERLKREQDEYYDQLAEMLQQSREERAKYTEDAHDGSNVAADDERYRLSGPYAAAG